jgi:hypothetical protein
MLTHVLRQERPHTLAELEHQATGCIRVPQQIKFIFSGVHTSWKFAILHRTKFIPSVVCTLMGTCRPATGHTHLFVVQPIKGWCRESQPPHVEHRINFLGHILLQLCCNTSAIESDSHGSLHKKMFNFVWNLSRGFILLLISQVRRCIVNLRGNVSCQKSYCISEQFVEAPCFSFFAKRTTDILIVINNNKNNTKFNKNINRSLDHLANITSTEAARRRIAVLAPPSPKLGKTCRSRPCYCRWTKSCYAKARKNQRSIRTTIGNDENYRSETYNRTDKAENIPDPRRFAKHKPPRALVDARRTNGARIGRGEDYSTTGM